MEELNFTDNFKVKFVQNNFLSILITNYILNSFILEDWKMLKMLNYHYSMLPGGNIDQHFTHDELLISLESYN